MAQHGSSRRMTSQSEEISLDMFNMVDEGISSEASHQRIENKIVFNRLNAHNNEQQMKVVDPILDY